MGVQITSGNGLLTYPQAAEFLGVGRRTLERLVARRKVRCLRPGPHSIRFRECDLQAYLSKTASISY